MSNVTLLALPATAVPSDCVHYSITDLEGQSWSDGRRRAIRTSIDPFISISRSRSATNFFAFSASSALRCRMSSGWNVPNGLRQV